MHRLPVVPPHHVTLVQPLGEERILRVAVSACFLVLFKLIAYLGLCAMIYELPDEVLTIFHGLTVSREQACSMRRKEECFLASLGLLHEVVIRRWLPSPFLVSDDGVDVWRSEPSRMPKAVWISQYKWSILEF